jgi:hypothetical protein
VADDIEYVILIYHNGVQFQAPVQGKKRYLEEKAFLEHLCGLQRSPDAPPRPIPDPTQDFYILDDDQLTRYSEFRREPR